MEALSKSAVESPLLFLIYLNESMYLRERQCGNLLWTGLKCNIYEVRDKRRNDEGQLNSGSLRNRVNGVQLTDIIK